MLDIITIGSATRDVFLLSKEFQIIRSPQFVGGEAECVSLGAKIDVESCTLTTGGGATNAAVTFSRLGFTTSIVTRVGDDEPARDVVADLERDGIDTHLVRHIKKGRTGYSTLLTTPTGERTVLVYRGVSAEFAAADVPFKALAAKWLYITSLSGNVELLEKIITAAKKLGTKVAFNPGHGEIVRSTYLRPLIAKLDVINLNLEEAQTLTGSTSKDGGELAQSLASGGETIAIVTDGPRGAYANQGKLKYYIKPHGIKSVSSTGAGDAFGSGVIAALAKGMTIEDALKVGSLNAENVIQHIGAKAGILTKWPKAKQLSEIRVFVSGRHV